MTSWQCSSRSISSDGMPEGMTRSVTFGALSRSLAASRQQQVALKIVRSDGDGGGPRCGLPLEGAAELLQLVQKASARSARLNACAVATMPRPDLTKSASCVIARNRSSVWLTADCVTPSRTAAAVTDCSSATATGTFSARASICNQSISFME
jgi:hypothetical protein